MKINNFALGIVCLVFNETAKAFLPHQISKQALTNNERYKSSLNRKYTQPTKLLTSLFDDFEEFESSSGSFSSSNDQDDIYASLRARQDSLSSSSSSSFFSSSNQVTDIEGNVELEYNMEDEISSNWENAQVSSSMRLTIDDWVRRIALDTYPLAVLGSANGNIYLCDLDKGEELDVVTSVHVPNIDDEDVNEAMKTLFGKFDGSGVIAVGINNDIVVTSGREGGLQVFKIDGEEESFYKGSRGGTSSNTKLHLESKGKLRYLDSSLITSVAFDDAGLLWTGSYDGFIRAFEYDDLDAPLETQKEPLYELDAGCEVLSITVNNKLGCGVAATASQKIVLFSIEDGEILAEWKPFGKSETSKRKREFARSAVIVQNDVEETLPNGEKREAVWSVVCGGSEGSMYQKRLNIDSMGYVSDTKPFLEDDSLRGRLRPSHAKYVMVLDSPAPGLLVTGSQDGTIRIWNCSYHEPKVGSQSAIVEEDDDDEEEAYYDDVGIVDRRARCCYALTGYKHWLGSIFTDGKMLVTDGSDNGIVVHDFSGNEDSEFLFEDDDFEDFTL